MVSYYAIKASSDLAAERGKYQSYEGSLWSQGILPIDSIKLLKESRGNDYLDVDESSSMDWDSLREVVRKQGMRNSNVMAIATNSNSKHHGCLSVNRTYLSKLICKIESFW